MPRNPDTKCDITFEERYGTTTSGNLPTHKTKVCIESTVNISAVQAEFPWVDIRYFHFYHMKCPYATEANVNYVRDTDKSSGTYWKFLEVPVGTLSDHTSTSGIMIRHSRGSKHGWLCVDPDCTYYQLYNTNYFYF